MLKARRHKLKVARSIAASTSGYSRTTGGVTGFTGFTSATALSAFARRRRRRRGGPQGFKYFVHRYIVYPPRKLFKGKKCATKVQRNMRVSTCTVCVCV